MEMDSLSSDSASCVSASVDSNNPSLMFPVGFDQSSLIKYSRPSLMLCGGAESSISKGEDGTGSDSPISEAHSMQPMYLQPHRGEISMKDLHGHIKDYSKIGKIKHKIHGMSHKQSIPYIRSQLNEKKLRLAASLANIEVVIELLEAGVNPNSSDDYQRSALHLASSRGYTDVVSQLLKYGAKPNLKDSLGNTPLHLAVCSASSFNFNMVVRILLKHGASVHSTDRNGKNPLDLVNSKLSLMRMRREKDHAPESSKILLDLSILTALLIHTYVKEEQELDMDSLEERLQKLSTNEVENEADMLLAKVEQLRLNN